MYGGQTIYQGQLTNRLAIDLHSKFKVSEFCYRELPKVAQTAVREYIRVKQCTYCHGQEGIPDPERPHLKIVCPECQGMGPRAWGDATRARSAGLTRYRWQKAWAQFYGENALPQLALYEQMFWGGLNKRLGGRYDK
jgi:hypothetical protein